MTESTSQDRRPSASEVVELFGGIRPMAAKLGVPVTTVQGWKERDAIPGRRWPEIEAAAARHGVALEATLAAPPPPAESPREPARTPTHMTAPATAVEAGAPSPEPATPKDEAKPAPETAAPSPYDVPRFAPWLALAAVVVVAAVSWSYWWPLFGPVEEPGTGGSPVVEAPAVEALAARVDALEAAATERVEEDATLAELRARAGDLEGRITGLEAAIGELRDWLARMAETEGTGSVEITGAQLAALRGRIAALERSGDDLAALASEAASAGETLAGLDTRLADLEVAVAEARARLDTSPAPAAPASDPETTAALASLGDRLAVLESVAPAGRPDTDFEALHDRLAALESAVPEDRLDSWLEALRDRLTALEAGADDPTASTVLAALRDRIAALEGSAPSAARAADLLVLRDRVATLEGAAAGAARDSDLAALGARLARLEAALGDADVDTALAALDEEGRRLDESIAALADRIAEAERRAARDAEGASAARALVLAIGQLRVALARATPFTSELTRLESLAEGDGAVTGAVAGLWRDAGRGIPTRALLAERFQVALRAVLRAEAEASGDWAGRVLSRLSGVISVRRTGVDVPGDEPEAVLARAEARLGAGDLAGAVATVETLTGPAAEAAAWLESARARLAAEQALDNLDAYATDLLADDGTGAP